MKTLHRVLIMTCAAIVASVAAGWARAAATNYPGTANQIVINEDLLDPLIGQPERDFHQASASLAKRQNGDSVSEVRSAAALLRLEAARRDAENRGGLETSADELDRLAAKIEKGEVSSPSELNPVFARADLALASHYHLMAKKALEQNEHDKAGRWLEAAADCVRHSQLWAGQEIPTQESEALDSVHALEAKIRTGANWSYDEAKRGVGYLGTQIQSLGKHMQNFGSSGAANTPSPSAAQ